MLQEAGLSSEATLQGMTELESGSVEGTIKLDSSSNNYLIERSSQQSGSRGRWMIQNVTTDGETQRAYIYQFKDSQRKILILQQADAQGYRRILFTDKSVNQALGGNNNRLLQAILDGDADRVTALLNAGANVNAIDDGGWTALMRAAFFKLPNIVAILLDKEADVNAIALDGTTALMLAAMRGSLGVVNALLANEANVNATNNHRTTALITAADLGNLNIVNALLDRGANIDAADNLGATALMRARVRRPIAGSGSLLAAHTRYATIESTLEVSAGLMLAARDGNSDEVNALLDRGANVHATDNHGRTALMLAARQGNSDIANALLDRGADIDAADNTGMTALMLAVAQGNLNMVKALLDRGANVDVTNIQGWTALMSAVRRGDPNIVKALLDRGADINITANGMTALKQAVEYNEQRPDNPHKTWRPGEQWMVKERLKRFSSPKYPEIIDILLKRAKANDQLLEAIQGGGNLEEVKALLDQGANVNAADKTGTTALMLAAKHGKSDVVSTLLAKGANIYATDNHGQTALKIAAKLKQSKIENTLKVAKATAELMLAVKNGDLNKVNRLLVDGANVNAADKTGTTALMLAAKHRASYLLNALLGRGANIAAADYRGRTALDLAVLFRNPSAVSALLDNLGRESSKEILIEGGINDIPLNQRFYLERIGNSQMLLAVRWEQGEPVMYLYPDQTSLPKGVIIEHLDSRESCTVGRQAVLKVGGIYSLADQDLCPICHENAVNIIPCSQSDNKHDICCIDCVSKLERSEDWVGICPSCSRDCRQDLKKHDLKKLRPKGIRIKQPIVDSLYLLFASLPAKNAELRKNSDGSIEYRIRKDKDQINSHSWHPIAFGLSAEFQHWLQSLPEEALEGLLENYPIQDFTAPFIDDQDIRDFVIQRSTLIQGDTLNTFTSNDIDAGVPRDRLILSNINMDRFGQEPSNWNEAAAARQQAIVAIRGQINRSHLNDEEFIRYIRSNNVWSYIPDAVKNLFNHKQAEEVSAGDRRILADNGIPTEWLEYNNQPFTYKQVRQRLMFDTLETWLQDRGNLTAEQVNVLSHYSATSALAYDIADGLDNLVAQTGNLSIMLNDSNRHWLAVNVTRNGNAISWQFGDSAYGNRSEATIQSAIQHAIHIYNLRRLEGYFQPRHERLVLGQRRPFNIRAEDTQDNAGRGNECAVYAWVYLENMRHGMSNSDAPARLISEISQKIRKD
jgi:ankyrin repeat protein